MHYQVIAPLIYSVSSLSEQISRPAEVSSNLHLDIFDGPILFRDANPKMLYISESDDTLVVSQNLCSSSIFINANPQAMIIHIKSFKEIVDLQRR